MTSCWPFLAITEARLTCGRHASVTPASARAASLWPRPAGNAGIACASRRYLGTQPLSLRIDEAGRANLDLDCAISHRVRRIQALADALRPANQQAEPDPSIERWRERRRGDDALVVDGALRGAARDEMCSRAKALRADDRPQSNQCRAVVGDERRPSRHHLSDESLL